ncbi:MAG: methyltransferase domain-containing protein [Minisyncoccia bacterium]
MTELLLKLTFIPGLEEIVLQEIKHYPEFHIIEKRKDAFYLDIIDDLSTVLTLKSIIGVSIIRQGTELNPHFLSKHKSLLGEIVERVLSVTPESFRTMKFSCAGADSKEVKEIQTFVKDTYKVVSAEEADMEISIGKQSGVWEVGVRLTNRPLSLRSYKVANIKGGLNPTIAYAMNVLAELRDKKTYLNVFSGSATLLIEAGLTYTQLSLLGFDNNGKSIALAVQNIKKAGLIKRIQLKNADIREHPDLGTFDCIVSDLPFGMQIGKDEDLDALYRQFVAFCEDVLSPHGVLVVYTTEHELLEGIFLQSRFTISQTLSLRVSTVVNAYIYPKIFVCRLK